MTMAHPVCPHSVMSATARGTAAVTLTPGESEAQGVWGRCPGSHRHRGPGLCSPHSEPLHLLASRSGLGWGDRANGMGCCWGEGWEQADSETPESSVALPEGCSGRERIAHDKEKQFQG